MNAITYQSFNCEEISEDLLDDYHRYQEVKRSWRKEKGEWVLKDNPYVEDWNLSKKRSVTKELLDCIQNGGAVFGAFYENKLVGFASLTSTFFGHRKEYLEMPMLHVSYECRRNGVGKQLFHLIADNARSMGARKIYISAHSSEESQSFYKSVGCVEAKEINQKMADNEPYDCQMEYVLL